VKQPDYHRGRAEPESGSPQNFLYVGEFAKDQAGCDYQRTPENIGVG
jgi:hypothetical protein